jgi:hypothetical protein
MLVDVASRLWVMSKLGGDHIPYVLKIFRFLGKYYE